MANKDKFEIIDKQTRIKNYIQHQLLSNGIIDADGNILDLPRFRSVITTEISRCNDRANKNTTTDGVVIDRVLQSTFLGEHEYLTSLAKHTKNINRLKEHPITSYEDLPKPNKKELWMKIRIAGAIIQNRISQWLRH